MFEWKLANELMLEYLEGDVQNVATAQEKIRMTKKFVKEQAAGITASLTNEQRITLIEMTVNKAQKNKEEKFRIQMPNKIIPVMAKEEPIEEKVAVGTENSTVYDLKRIIRNAAKRKE